MFRRIIKNITPPIIGVVYRKIASRKSYGMWQGNFANWDAAKKQCRGYDDPVILEKTKIAILKVKNGEAAGERDSVLFDKIQYSWPVIAFLLKIAIENNNQLNIIDFGGSLGSSYFQTREMIPENINLAWNVVEQQSYVDVGNQKIKDEHLSFYYSIDEALKKTKASVLLLSSVIQYLEKPYEFINAVLPYNFNYIIVDRTAFIDPIERLTVQNVPEYIYPASYPAWFFDAGKFQKAFSTRYKLLAEFEPYPGMIIPLDRAKGHYKGFIFKLQDQQ